MPPSLPNSQDPAPLVMPNISITIPYASANYCTEEMHVLYCLEITDQSNELVWHCFQRYSLFRKLHQSLGKYCPNKDIPGLLLMSRSNRSKKEIERRRVLLAEYVNSLCAAVFDPTISVEDPKLLSPRVEMLCFLEYPFVGDWEAAKFTLRIQGFGSPSMRSDSTVQQVFPSGGDPSNPFIVTHWLPPPVLPGGENFGLILPFAELRLGVNKLWEVHIRSEKRAQRGLLRYRYDELAAVSEALSRSDILESSRGMQELIMAFRKRHTLSNYLDMDDDINRSEKSSQYANAAEGAEGAEEQWERAGRDRRSLSEGGGSNTREPPPSDECTNSVHNVLLPFQHRASPFADAPQSKPSPPPHDSHRTESELTPNAYVSMVCGPPVAGCRCTPDALCASADGNGDVYQLQCGYALFVYPPPSPK